MLTFSEKILSPSAKHLNPDLGFGSTVLPLYLQLYKLSQCITGISGLPICSAPYYCNSHMHHTQKLPKETWLY